MRYAVISDVHGETHTLHRFLKTIALLRIDLVLTLGDNGGDSTLDLLRQVSARGTFGNYEVSAYHQLSLKNQGYVRRLPAVFEGDNFLAAHAVPYLKPGLSHFASFRSHILSAKASLSSLFPYLGAKDGTIWKTLAELEVRRKQVFFHGHTHRQTIAAFAVDYRSRRVAPGPVTLREGEYYVVGVGSLGRPQGTEHPCYAVYDSLHQTIELSTLSQ